MSCHENITSNSAKLTLIDDEYVLNKDISAYDLMNSEQTLLSCYGSLAAFAKLDMYTWDYTQLSATNFNWGNNYLELNASSAIVNLYNSANVSYVNPLGVIGETYIDPRVMPWIYSMNYNAHSEITKYSITSSSVFGPLSNPNPTPTNIGPGTEIPISYMFYLADQSTTSDGFITIEASLNTSELIAFNDFYNLLKNSINDNHNKIIYNNVKNLWPDFTTIRSPVYYNRILPNDRDSIYNYQLFGKKSAYFLYSDTGIIRDLTKEPNNGEFKYITMDSPLINNNELEFENSLILNFTPFKDLSYSINKNVDYISSTSALAVKDLSYKYGDSAIKVYDVDDDSISAIQWGRSEDQIHDLITDTSSSASGMVISETNFAGLLVSDGLNSSDNLIAYIDFGQEKSVVEDALIYGFTNNKFIDITLNE